MAKKTRPEWFDAVRATRAAANRWADETSTNHVLDILDRAQESLEDRLDWLAKDLGDSFTNTEYELLLSEIEDVIVGLVGQLQGGITADALKVAERSANEVLGQLAEAEEEFSSFGEFGIGLGIDAAMVMDSAVTGTKSSALRRLTGEAEEADAMGGIFAGDGDSSDDDALSELEDEIDPIIKDGILTRYGINTIGEFEDVLRSGLLTDAAVEDIIDDLTDRSPFLQGKPRFWAERIARTEMMNAYNHSAWEASRNVEDQMGEDMVKILVEIDDDRTGWDSYAVHGQVRRMDEPFEYIDYNGNSQYYMYPPNRPNDRACVVYWNPAWGAIPDEMQPFDDDRYISAWYEVYKKKAPPGRAPLTTLSDEEMAPLWPGSATSESE